MAIKLFRIVLVSLALALLGSCSVLQFIFGSVFPATLTLTKAQADLSNLIGAGNGSSFSIRVVEAGSKGYVVVEGSVQGAAKSIFVYDLDLKLKLSLTGATAPLGIGVMADANGQIRAGGALYSPDLLTSAVGGPVINGNFGSGNDGFLLNNPPVENAVNISINTTVNPNTLDFDHYHADWTLSDHHSVAISASLTSLQIDAVLDDGNPSGKVIFVISQSNSGGNGDNVTRYFVTIAKSDMAAGTVPLDLVDTAPRKGNLKGGTIGFADGNIFAFDNKTSSLVRIDPADLSTRESLALGNNKNELRYAYSISGGTFYSFDTNSLILTKYVAWW
jgi:hypothetical protein